MSPFEIVVGLGFAFVLDLQDAADAQGIQRILSSSHNLVPIDRKPICPFHGPKCLGPRQAVHSKVFLLDPVVDQREEEVAERAVKGFASVGIPTSSFCRVARGKRGKDGLTVPAYQVSPYLEVFQVVRDAVAQGSVFEDVGAGGTG